MHVNLYYLRQLSQHEQGTHALSVSKYQEIDSKELLYFYSVCSVKIACPIFLTVTIHLFLLSMTLIMIYRVIYKVGKVF